mmetsp:Transcript_69747/g.116198  ORF Transcript_69747/g.116198 Transcript_69747/m.116198 type:complete len:130 (-) Transcript_69747:806-1195(-)
MANTLHSCNVQGEVNWDAYTQNSREIESKLGHIQRSQLVAQRTGLTLTVIITLDMNRSLLVKVALNQTQSATNSYIWAAAPDQTQPVLCERAPRAHGLNAHAHDRRPEPTQNMHDSKLYLCPSATQTRC